MRLKFYLLLSIALFCIQNQAHSDDRVSVRDSVIIYKTEGLKEFMKVVDSWGNDTEAYLAYDKAYAIIDSISDYSKYHESLARIYAAKSHISYGLSYVPSVLEESRKCSLEETDVFPKVGINEVAEIVIKDYVLPESDFLHHLTALECRALYSMLYYFKAIDLKNFEERLLPDYMKCMTYEELYSSHSPQTAYRMSSVLNMQLWYCYIILCAQISYWEKYDQAPDLETKPWKEFMELANWHASLPNDPEVYENMSEKEFQEIELKAAYTQYIMLLHIAKNLSEIKERNN